MVLNPAYFGTVSHQNTMIHEMGHILGLYHVFKGVSERESCDDPCQVTVFSGHLCDMYIKLRFYFQISDNKAKKKKILFAF